MPATASVAHARLHRNVDLSRGGEFDRARITCVGVTKDAHAGIAGEDALEAAFGIFGAVGDDDHPGVLRETDADAAAVVNRNPRRAGGSVDNRVEQRPLGDAFAAL